MSKNTGVEYFYRMGYDAARWHLNGEKYREALHDIANASNHAELINAILKHKDVLRECM